MFTNAYAQAFGGYFAHGLLFCWPEGGVEEVRAASPVYVSLLGDCLMVDAKELYYWLNGGYF